jgi:hypothetical protein
MLRLAIFRYATRMRSSSSPLYAIFLAGAAGILGTGCGSSASTPRRDAAISPDVPISTGGALGTGGMTGIGGAVGTGGRHGLGGVTGTGGSVARDGSMGTGGTLSTGGSSAAGSNDGSPSGVLLTSTYDGQVHATWQNQTSQSIFLAGCGTVEWSRLEGADWVNHGGFVMCVWEGVAVEVAAGATYTETQGFARAEAGRYQLSGQYGVGCTPGLALSKAGCTAFFTATSNEFVVLATGRGGGAGAGGSTGNGGASGASGAGTGGTTTGDGGQPSIYSGCIYIGGINRAVVAKFDPQTSICVALLLTQPNHADAGLGMTIAESWGLEGTGMWTSPTPDCTHLTSAPITMRATSASGNVSVNYSSTAPTIDIDAVLSFPASDAGPAQSVELKAQGVDINHGC